MTTTGAARYGNYYWAIRTGVLGSGHVFAFADRIEVTPNGDLVLWRNGEYGEYREIQNMSFAKGHWVAFYAASVIDGRAVAAEYSVSSPIDNA